MQETRAKRQGRSRLVSPGGCRCTGPRDHRLPEPATCTTDNRIRVFGQNRLERHLDGTVACFQDKCLTEQQNKQCGGRNTAPGIQRGSTPAAVWSSGTLQWMPAPTESRWCTASIAEATRTIDGLDSTENPQKGIIAAGMAIDSIVMKRQSAVMKSVSLYRSGEMSFACRRPLRCLMASNVETAPIAARRYSMYHAIILWI